MDIVLGILLILFIRGCSGKRPPYFVPAFCYLYTHKDQSASYEFLFASNKIGNLVISCVHGLAMK